MGLCNKIANLPPDAQAIVRLARNIRLLLLCHAYTPLLSLVLLNPADQVTGLGNFAKPVVALAIAAGSLGFVFAKRLSGRHADANGPAITIIRSTRLMAVAMTLLAFVFVWQHFFAMPPGWVLMTASFLQLLLGYALGLMDGADRSLLRDALFSCGVTAHPNDALDGEIRSHDFLLRTSSVAIGALLGAVLFATVRMLSPDAPRAIPLAGALSFAATAVLQLLAGGMVQRLAKYVPQLSRIATQRPSNEARKYIASVLVRDTELDTLINLTGVVDGWLMFLSSAFSVSALTRIVLEFDPMGMSPLKQLTFVVLIALMFWALASMQSVGTYIERYWRRRIITAVGNDARAFDNRLRQAALSIIAIGIAALTLHLILAAFVSSGVLVVAMYVLVQVLRGFSQALLLSTVDAHVESRQYDHGYAIRGQATMRARALQVLTAIISVGAAALILYTKQASVSPLQDTLTISAVMMMVFVTSLTRRISKFNLRTIWTASARRMPQYIRVVLTDMGRFVRVRANSIVSLLFLLSLLGANWTGAKLVLWSPAFIFNTGAVFYALAFLFVDTLVERHNARDGLYLYIIGVAFNVLCVVVLAICDACGAQAGVHDAAWLFAGSTLSFTVAQLFDVQIFSALKTVTQGRALWARYIISGFVAQAVDTVLFVSVASVPLVLTSVFAYISGQMLVKWGVVIMTCPMAYVLQWCMGPKGTQESSFDPLIKKPLADAD